ncbi:MAG TPA: hypothetical protein VFP80_15625 [Thermoanaerobaculia bacterium]|nr:hypothetical protein [Thermoanaerobaculia bacterium]
MIGEFLNRMTTALEMHGIPYMLTGSVASSLYGVPRATNDVDIVIAPQREQLPALVQMLQRSKLTVANEHAIAAFREGVDRRRSCILCRAEEPVLGAHRECIG